MSPRKKALSPQPELINTPFNVIAHQQSLDAACMVV
jgi:hypothetical protein